MLVMGKFLRCLAHSLSSGAEGKFQDYPGEMHLNYTVLFLHSLIHHIPNTHIVYRSCAIIKHYCARVCEADFSETQKLWSFSDTHPK